MIADQMEKHVDPLHGRWQMLKASADQTAMPRTPDLASTRDSITEKYLHAVTAFCC